MKSYDITWQKDDNKVTISKNYFEHLLNCLANQKYVGELPTCGDALAEGPEKYKNIQEENQKVIDKAWKEGMFILTHECRVNSEYVKLVNKYAEYYNKNIEKMEADFVADKEEYMNDQNIDFKWTHLFQQEVIMWSKLCSNTHAIIDCENEKYEVGQVSIDDFNEIIRRRGFTPKLIAHIKLVLKEIGIGDNL